MSSWRVWMKTVMLGALVAMLATVLLQHAAPVQQGERTNAASTAASETLVRSMRLAAGTKCIELGSMSRGTIEGAFGGHQMGSAGSLYAGRDVDPSREGTVQYNPSAKEITIVAQADGDCSQHGRRLGGTSPWIGGALGSGFGLMTRLGLLSVLLSYGVPVTFARPISEAAGGVVSGALSQYLISGKFTVYTVAAGLFGAVSAVAGGTFSRKIIENSIYLPRQAANAARGLRGVGGVAAQAGNFAADALDAVQAPFERQMRAWLAAHPQ